MKNELRSGLGMYTPNLKSARESKYLALKKKKKEGKIKTVFIKGDQNLSKWPYDLTQIDFKLVKSVSEFRVPVENQQLSVSRKKIKQTRGDAFYPHFWHLIAGWTQLVCTLPCHCVRILKI